MARAYGYGATMGAWCTDYLSYWAGHDGMVRHTKQSFRLPSFEGDISYVDAERIEEHRLSELEDEMTVGELYGMQTFDQSLVQLYRNGLVERVDAVAHSSAPGEIESQ